MKKVIVTIFVLSLVLFSCFVTYASENEVKKDDTKISFRFISIGESNPILTISSGRAKISVRISGNSRVSKIKANISLQKYSGGSWKNYNSYVKSWRGKNYQDILF